MEEELVATTVAVTRIVDGVAAVVELAPPSFISDCVDHLQMEIKKERGPVGV